MLYNVVNFVYFFIPPGILKFRHNVIIFCTFDFNDGFVINSEFIASSFKSPKDLLANMPHEVAPVKRHFQRENNHVYSCPIFRNGQMVSDIV